VQQSTFYCHREVLALASPFFGGVLAGGWRETEPVPRPAKEEKRKSSASIISNEYEQEEAAFGLPDDPLYPSSSSSDTASLADAVPPSMTASYAASSVVADSEEDEDDYDSFVECRLRICEETASSASPSFLQIPLVLSHKLTSLLCRLSRPPLPHLPSTGLSNLLGKRRRPHPDELEVRPSELDECLSGFPSSIGCWSTGFVHEDR
jgi:hypothetical protein